jgi:hypothetical protein
MEKIPAPVPEVVAWVGLDWSDQHHEIRLQAVGSPRIESFKVEQKLEAFARLGRRFARALPPRERSPWLWSSRAGRWSMR